MRTDQCAYQGQSEIYGQWAERVHSCASAPVHFLLAEGLQKRSFEDLTDGEWEGMGISLQSLRTVSFQDASLNLSLLEVEIAV